jgi:hypothetical protein
MLITMIDPPDALDLGTITARMERELDISLSVDMRRKSDPLAICGLDVNRFLARSRRRFGP